MAGAAPLSSQADPSAPDAQAAGGYRLAYVSRVAYPDQTANALQTIHMASALANQLGQASLFVHDLATSEADVRRHYAVPAAPLRIVPLRTQRWPTAVRGHGLLRFILYNSSVAASLGLQPVWRQPPYRQNVLFVRSRLEILYWGLLRPYLAWLRQWQFMCEVHDLQLPMRANENQVYDDRSPRAERFTQALRAYDHVLAVTHGLAEDIAAVTRGRVAANVVPLSTGLERLSRPPALPFASRPIVLGYVGTLDWRHGLEDCLQAMLQLPDTFRLRLVGRSDSEVRLRQWLSDHALTRRVELIPPVPYTDVARTLDQCDVALAPAGQNIHSHRHRSPLKIFDYMARGKPIVAADVPCHRELLQPGVTAQFYRCGNAADLAVQIRTLADCPQKAQAMAAAAWQQSAFHTYTARARQIYALLQQAPGQPKARQS